ncbi:sigma-70 family RNA polymerase sigma factor [bacterium]|nr:sigma-70 family RNA polymerase sigma factor [bacterium]
MDKGSSEDAGAITPQSSDAFFSQVYDELRSIAHARVRGERAAYTLQTTELVHEAYLRLAPRDGGAWESRGQFFAAAAEAMRRILIERARAKGRVKRGGDADGRPAPRVSLDLAEVAALADDADPEMVLALDRAIERLAEREARVAQVVKLRFYAGLSVEEVAETLDLTPRTILRDWAFARAWLLRELTRD